MSLFVESLALVVESIESFGHIPPLSDRGPSLDDLWHRTGPWRGSVTERERVKTLVEHSVKNPPLY